MAGYLGWSEAQRVTTMTRIEEIRKVNAITYHRGIATLALHVDVQLLIPRGEVTDRHARMTDTMHTNRFGTGGIA